MYIKICIVLIFPNLCILPRKARKTHAEKTFYQFLSSYSFKKGRDSSDKSVFLLKSLAKPLLPLWSSLKPTSVLKTNSSAMLPPAP